MTHRLVRAATMVCVAGALAAGALAAPGAAVADDHKVLRIGWDQDPQVLNPYTYVEGQNFTVAALTWDMLVGFDNDDLSPTAGIADSWTVSDDGLTVEFHIPEGRLWSDGEPITSEDVKFTLDSLGKEGTLFAGYASSIVDVQAPDPTTAIVTTSAPDTRIIGGLFMPILPEHVWGQIPIEELTGVYQPELPIVGSGPYIITEFDRGRILRLERNPHWQGPAPDFDEVQFITYGNQDAVERALTLGEIDFVNSAGVGGFEKLGQADDVATVYGLTASFTELSFNMCPASECPDAEFNPAVQDRTVRQAIAYAIDRERLATIAGRGASTPGHGQIPAYYTDFYEKPAQDYPLDIDKANQLLDEAGYLPGADGIRERDGVRLSFTLYARAEAQYEFQLAKLIAEMVQPIGVEFTVESVSTDRLYELTASFVDDKPAPTFDAFVWNWEGDPYDPGLLLSIMTTSEIGNSSDAFYSNPEYDRLYAEQATLFNPAERKKVIQQMVAILQEDLPYLVLGYDFNLQAYRTDRIGNVHQVCPAGTGDVFCEGISYQPILQWTSLGSSSPGTAPSPLPWIAGGAAALAVVVLLGVLVARRRRSDEVEETGP